MSSNIVLIGNGPSVMDREAGAEIDGFDTVVRFNNFQTEGFEKHVGTKTDVWVTRICSTIQPRSFDKKIVGVINHCAFTPAIKAMVPNFKNQYSQLEIIDNKEVKGYAKTFGYNPNERWLSVGMIYLMHLLDHPDMWDSITLYGFSGNAQEHYFKTTPVGEEFHNFEHEGQRLAILETQGKIERMN